MGLGMWRGPNYTLIKSARVLIITFFAFLLSRHNFDTLTFCNVDLLTFEHVDCWVVNFLPYFHVFILACLLLPPSGPSGWLPSTASRISMGRRTCPRSLLTSSTDVLRCLIDYYLIEVLYFRWMLTLDGQQNSWGITRFFRSQHQRARSHHLFRKQKSKKGRNSFRMAIFVNSLKVARKNRLEELHISFQILST